MTTLILGATGFVGRNLLDELLKKDDELRLLVRDPSKLLHSASNLKIFKGDLLHKDTLQKVFKDVHIIYYLVHAMASEGDYEQLELIQAQNVADYLTKDQTIIYLSGLAQGDLSKHMRSRQHVGGILRSTSAKVIELRSSIVIGAGSASFDMMSALVSRFPFILDSSWGRALCQPIGIADLIQNLILASGLEKSEIIEIGGPQKVSYVELLSLCADIKNIRRPVLKINSFPKDMALKMMEIFLPEHFEVGKKLFSSIELDSIVTKKSKKLVKRPQALEAAIRDALDKNQEIKQISIEEFFTWAQSIDLKRQLSDMELIENFNLIIPIRFTVAKNILSKFITILKLSPFKTFEIEEEDFGIEDIKFCLKNTKGPKFELAVNMQPEDNDTHLWILSRYHARGFIDSASYAAFRSFSEKWTDKIAKVF